MPRSGSRLRLLSVLALFGVVVVAGGLPVQSARAADVCSPASPTAEAPAPYRIVLLVDRSGSMQKQAEGIARARKSMEAMLRRYEGAPASAVGITLASFGSRVIDVWPAKGRAGTVSDALAELPRFFPTAAAEYGEGDTCIYRSVFEASAAELGLSSPGQDLARPAAWDFLVFTDGGDNCDVPSGAERAWLDRNRKALRYKVWPVDQADAPDLTRGGEIQYSWSAPLQPLVNLSQPLPPSVPIPDPPAVTFTWRLLAGEGASACPASKGGEPPEITFRLAGPEGTPVDQPAWKLVGEAPPSSNFFQARWQPGTVHLPKDVPAGRWTLSPDPTHLCGALGAVAPGRPLAPLSTPPGCAAAVFDTAFRPTVDVSGDAGPLDGGVTVTPGWFGGYGQAEVSGYLKSVDGRRVQLAVETSEGGLAVPDEAVVCEGAACAGEVTVEAFPGDPKRFTVRVQPRDEPWWPASFFTGAEGPPTGDQSVRLCARGGDAALACQDCQRPASEGCVTLPVTVRPLRLHAWSIVSLFAAGCFAFYIWVTPRFDPQLFAGTHNLRRIHGPLRPYLRRPLRVGKNSRQNLEVQAWAAGAVCELRPDPAGGAGIFVRALGRPVEVGGRQLPAGQERAASVLPATPVTLTVGDLSLVIEKKKSKS